MKLLLLCILLIILVFLSKRLYSGNVRQYSKIDNSYYFVKNQHNEKTKTIVADKLANVSKKGNLLINVIQRDEQLKNQIKYKRLLKKWPTLQIDELNIEEKGVFAFNVNKGYKISLCLVDNDVNDIMFVFLHELTHIMTYEVGHPPQFWDNFKEILELSIKHDVYKYRNYNDKHAKFCNLVLDSTPLTNNNK